MTTKNTKKVMTGVGITAAVAAAAAGAYYFYGTADGKKKRKKMEAWAIKARKEVISQIEKLKDVNEDAYHQIVDTVTEKYKKLKDANPAELALMARELKGHWGNIQREFQKSKSTVAKMAKVSRKKARAVKRAVKGGKVAKKRRGKRYNSKVDLETLTTNHYVCAGECRSVSENPGICPVKSCSKHGEPLVSCTCEDGKHAEIWNKQTPYPTAEGF